MRRTVGRRLLRFEALESRAMLDGSITAHVLGGTLFIKGDDLDNAVVITPGPLANQVVVTGVDNTNVVAPFQVPQLSVTFNNVYHSICINMRGGDDVVVIQGLGFDATVQPLFVRCNLSVDLGWGDDVLVMSSVNVGGSVKIKTGWGDDVVAIAGVDLPNLGNGINNDLPDLADLGITVNLAPVTIRGCLEVCTDGGVDVVGIANTTVWGSMKIGGHDIALLQVFNSTVIHTTVMSTGVGSDLVAINGFQTGKLWLDTGPGNDAVQIGVGVANGNGIVPQFGLQAACVWIKTGAGDDNVSVNNTYVYHDMVIQLEWGNDNLALGALGPVTVWGSGWLDGGCGVDLLLNSPLNFFGKLFVRHFEGPYVPVVVV